MNDGILIRNDSELRCIVSLSRMRDCMGKCYGFVDAAGG